MRFALLLIILYAPPLQALAETKDDSLFQMFTLYFENDAFFGTDYFYTNGIKFAWTSGDLKKSKSDSLLNAWTCSLGGLLPLVGAPGFKRSLSLAVGQNMYTPEDTQDSELIENSRPYAGLTYFEIGISGRNSLEINSWEVVLGMVGPHSYAGDTQKAVHNWNGWDAPNGWDHQLKDEPILNLFFTQRRKILNGAPGGQWGCDIIPSWGGGVGNLYTGAQAGVQIRLGWNLPNDFGTSMIRPGSNTNTPMDEDGRMISGRPHRFGVHLFAGADGFYCLRNMTLDGNTFQESHSIPKEPFVASFMAGLGVTISRCKISFAHVYQTKEFKQQKDQEQFGSITFHYMF